jgi:hypothetical protein
VGFDLRILINLGVQQKMTVVMFQVDLSMMVVLLLKIVAMEEMLLLFNSRLSMMIFLLRID